MPTPHTYAVDARTATPHFPGIGRYVSGLIPELAAQLTPGEQLAILCTDETQAAHFRSAVTVDATVTTHVAPYSPFSLRQQWGVPRLLRRMPVAPAYHSPYYLMPYWPGVPAVVTIHDLIPLLFPNTVSARGRAFFRMAVRLALRAAERVIVGAEASRRDLMRAFNVASSRISVTPYAANPTFHPRSFEEIDRVRRKLALPGEYILYFGSNKPHKNLVGLVQAYATMAAKTDAKMDAKTDAALVIAGRWDPAYPEAQQCAASLGMVERVRFLGPVDEADLPALYSGAACFVFPSRYEGFGLPVLEAMACGTAVACSNTSSLPEVAGDAALYFAPEDIAGLAYALRTLMSNPSLRCGLAERGLRLSKGFSWSRTAAQTLEVYRSLEQ